VRVGFWPAVFAGTVGVTLAVLTACWPEWLEAVLPVDLDGGSGTVEWLISGVFLLVGVASYSLAAVEWRRSDDPLDGMA
jgi:hypothetical protein